MPIKVDTWVYMIFKLSYKSTWIFIIFNLGINIFILRYFAVDTAFPYHFNVITNLNFFGGTTLTAYSTYSFVINYPSYVPGRLYTQFTNPLSNYKILFFLTCFKYVGTYFYYIFRCALNYYPVSTNYIS